MLESKHKLNSVEFSRTFGRGKKIHTDSFTVLFLADQEYFKTAVVVSKKHTKTAIMRNYKRRVVFNVLAKINNSVSGGFGCVHIIFIIKKKSLHTPYEQLEQELKEIQMRI